MKRSFILLVITVFSLLSCDEPAEKKALAVIYDQTDSTYVMPSIEKVIPVGLDALGFAPKDVPRDEVTVVYSKIIDTSIQPYHSVTLKKGKNFWLTNHKERLSEIASFMEEMKKGDMVLMQEPNKGFQQSYVQSCLCENLLPLRKFDAVTALIFSDIFQHSDAVSFYDYRRYPERLYEDDFELVSKKLDKICPAMKDGILERFSLIVVFMPQKEDDSLHLAVRRFWMRYLSEKKGATVKFVPHLDNVMT